MTEETILKACAYRKRCNTKTVAVNRPKTVLFWILIELIYVLFIKNVY
jgi:hypothetical protein